MISQLQKKNEMLESEKESFDDQLMYDVIELESQLKKKETDFQNVLKVMNPFMTQLAPPTQ